MKVSSIQCRIICCALLFLVFPQFFLTGCSSLRHIDTQKISTVDLSNNSADLSVLEKISTGETIEEPLIIVVPEGYSLPVHIDVDTPLAHMNSKESTLIFDKELYLYFSNQGILVSSDGDQWADFSDMQEVNALFGGGKGEFKVGMSADTTGALLDITLSIQPVATSR